MILLPLLLGCGDPEGVAPSSGAAPVDFVGPVGRVIELVPPGAPEDPSVSLVVLEGSWELQAEDGAGLAYPTHLGTDDGFRVDEVLLLPPRLAPGTEVEGARVEAVGSYTTWYGTFPDTVSVRVAEGDFAGTAVFARDIGPIALVWAGWAGELATYE